MERAYMLWCYEMILYKMTKAMNGQGWNLAVVIEHEFSKYRGVLGSLIYRFLHVRE